ncbi:phospholipase D-like domain-containing protein [Streptomyces sp. NBC_01216]|uniref:phospholipase D-like domain-containing protein n=1 Tax=unclassified Streptomyces TaxID=2593676 RepID=UPI002E14C4BF|nr:phospholipase D-like domain-containing protein [Streptomyces sp. NBC_01216]
MMIKGKFRTAATSLALGGLLLATPAAGAAEPVPTVTTGPVFNDPSGDTAAEGRILSHLGRLVDGAEAGSSIRISLYLYGSQWLTDRLLAAHARGVTVQMILDHDTAGYPAVSNLRNGLTGDSWVRVCEAEEACLAKDPGTTAADPDGWYDNVNHNKTFLFSRTRGNGAVAVDDVVVQSSGNLVEWDRTSGWNDAMTVVGNKALFDAYTAYFTDQARAAAGEVPRVADYAHDTQAGPAKVYFFPRSDTDVIVNVLRTVARPVGTAPPCHGNDAGFGTSDGRTRIRIAQGHITRPEVAEQLWRLADAGCLVEIVYRKLDNWPLNPDTAARVADWLTRPTARGRIALHQLGNDVRGGTGTHTKYLLVEGTYYGGANKKIVFTGSHTYTVTALKYNDETLLKYEDPAVFDAYVANFEAQRTAAEGEGR